MRSIVAIAVAVLAGCFERGGKQPPPEPAPAAGSAAPTDAGWAVRDPDGPADPAAVVRVALEAEPATLDPFATLDAVSGRVLGAVVEGLLCAPDGGAVIDCVAASHTVEDGGLRWRFTLDGARRFSDGAPVTAADVVASLRAARGEGHAAGPLGAILDDATAIRADGDAIEIGFATPRSTRARDLTLVPIVPAAQLASPTLATAPIGTGPFRVAAWERGRALRLARVAGARRVAAAAEIELVLTADRADALRRLIAGELDVVGQVPIDQAIATTAAHAELARFRYALPAYLAAIYNTRRVPPSVRRALTMVLDRDGIARAFLGGARTLTGPYLPGTPGYDAGVAAPPFDRAAARALLAGDRPAIELLVPAGSTTSARIADVWSADARGVIAVKVTALPFADLLARLAAGDFDAAITSMSAGPDVDLSSRLASDAPRDQAWPGISDRALDILLAEEQVTGAPERRAELQRAIHRRVAALAPMAFIAVDTRAGLARADVGGVVGAQPGPPPVERLVEARAMIGGAIALGKIALRVLTAWVVTCVLGWGLVELARDPPALVAARAAAALPPDDARDPGARARVVERFARELALGGSAPARIARAGGRALVLDAGVSWRDRRPVGAVVRGGARATLGRALAAMILALAAGVAAAIAAGRRGRSALAVGAGALLAIPTVWLCQLALGAAPGLATSATLAIVALAAAPAAAIALHVGAALRRLDDSPLAIAAAARGIGPRRWRAVHALRLIAPGLAPLVPSVAGFVLGASPVVERALAVPGAGQILVAAAGAGDAPIVIALAAGTAAAVALAGGLAQLAARRLDPRLA